MKARDLFRGIDHTVDPLMGGLFVVPVEETKKNDTPTKKSTTGGVEGAVKKTAEVIERGSGAAAKTVSKTVDTVKTTPTKETPIEKTPTMPKLDYSSAVQFLKNKGVSGASGIMTEHEWGARNRNGGTYQDYLIGVISKYGAGNINLNKQPLTTNEEGTRSTIDSVRYYDERDKKHVLLPIDIYVDGEWKRVSGDEAWQHYLKTGEHLGKFDTEDEAGRYATNLYVDHKDYYKSVQKHDDAYWDKRYQEELERARKQGAFNPTTQALKIVDEERSRENFLYAQAQYGLKGIEFAEKIRNDPKFEEYVAAGEAMANEKDGFRRKNPVAYLRNNPDAMYQYEKTKKTQTSYDPLSPLLTYPENVIKLVKYGTQGQLENYYAYLGKGDKKGAEEYLKGIEQSLNNKMGMAIAAEKDTMLEKYEFGVSAGLDQFGQGMKNIFNFSDDYIPVSPTQVASGQVRESLKDVGPEFLGSSLGQGVYDFITTTTNMAPSILASTVSNIVVPGSGAFVGAGLMGGSASGNAYQEKLNAGWNKGQARFYSAAVGVSEAGLQYLLGGIGSLGGTITKTNLEAIAKGINNAVGRFAVRYGGKIVSEGIEESLQEVLTPFFENLALGYAKNGWSDIDWEQVAYSGMLGMLSAGFLEGGPTAVNTVSEVRNEKNIGKVYAPNVDDLIQSGLESDPESEAYKIAEKMQDKKYAGKSIRNAEVGRAVQAIEEEIRNESAQPDSLEQAAKDVVANNERKVSAAREAGSKGVPRTVLNLTTVEEEIAYNEGRQAANKGTPILQRVEAMSLNNEPITVEEAKQASGYGENGAKVLADTVNNSKDKSFSQVKGDMHRAYIDGLTNKKINFNNDFQQEAYFAGKKDRTMQTIADKASAKNAVINKESGFSAKNLPSDVTPNQVEIINTMAEALGLKSYIAKGLDANAEINHATGEVAIDYDFEREIGTGASRQKVSIVFHAAHEMALHRVVELAPEEGRAFVYEMYKHLAKGDSSNITLADQKRNAYGEQGVEISLAKAMEEISANNILYLYNNDEAKFHKAIDRIVNGKNEKAKQGLRKYIDYLNNIIKKIWNFLSDKSAQERAKYQPELDEVTRLRDMFELAFAKAVENRKTLKSNQNQTNGTDKEFSLKVAKKKGTWYNEYQTNALSWARSTERQVGDVTILNANGKYFALIEATDDGFIELVKGNYQEVSAEYERIHVEKDTSFYEDTQEIRTERNSDMWDLQYVEDGGNASGNGQPVGSERLQTDTTGNNEHLRSGDKGKSFSLKQDKNDLDNKIKKLSDEEKQPGILQEQDA